MARAKEKRQRLIEAAKTGGDPFLIDGRRVEPRDIIDLLQEYLTENRRVRIEEVLQGRTRSVATVVEGLVNMGNVSAVMRSAEALGYQSFHVITGDDWFKDSKRTSQGAEKWLDVFQWPSPADCIGSLKDEGFRIVVTHLDESSVPIDEIDFTRKTALVFGNELEGVSEEMLRLSDARCVIPMGGFVQSFNISVAAAVSLYHAYRDRLERQGHHGDLDAEEKEVLRAVYYLRSVRNADAILKRALSGGRGAGRGNE